MTRSAPVAWLCLAPGVLVLIPLLVCSLVVLRISFGDSASEWTGFNLVSYARLATPFFQRSFGLTIRLAAESAILDVLLALPVALVMARLSSPFWRQICFAAVLLPLLVNLLLQSYGWLILLGPAGIVNRALLGMGLVDRPVRLLYAEPGVLAGLVQTAFPLAVLPITHTLRGVPAAMQEAAATLGANRVQTLMQIVLPLALPGIISGGVLVFAYNASAFAVPLLLGGGRVAMLGVVIHTEVAPLLDWPQASAASVALAVAVLALTGLAGRWAPR